VEIKKRKEKQSRWSDTDLRNFGFVQSEVVSLFWVDAIRNYDSSHKLFNRPDMIC
jgi:hypothetical protein